MAYLAFTIKTLLFSILVYRFGFFYAILITYLRVLIINTLLKLFLNYDLLQGFDNLFAVIPNEKKFINTGFLILDDYKPEKWKEIFKERGINQFPRFRKVIVSFLGSLYWKDASLSKAYDAIKIFKDRKMNSVEEICLYSIREHEKIFKLGEIPWEFQFMPYGESQGIIFLKFDHAFSDGVGFLGFLIALADNYDISLFPKYYEMSFYMRILIILTSPFYAVKALINEMTLKIHKSPFKRDTMKPGDKRLYVSEKINFNKVAQVSKKLNITFNDLIVALVSKNYKIYVKELDKKYNTSSHLDTFTISSPVSLRPLPKKLKDCVIDNNLTSHSMEIPLIENLEKEKDIIKNTLSRYLKNPFYSFGKKFLNDYLVVSIPEFLVEQAIADVGRPLDILISNVPGPRKEIFYGGSRVNTIMGTPNTGFFSNLLDVVSYNGEFSFTVMNDDKIKADMKVFIKMIEADLDELVSNL